MVALKAQTEPYETHKGDAAALQEKWLDTICGWVMEDKGWSGREIKAAMPKIAAEFAAIPVRRGTQGEGGRGRGDLREILPPGQQ